MALGPFRGVQCFGGYLANGFRFHTSDIEKKRKNQNSGVMVKGIVESKDIDYYGVLNDIISLQYLDGKRVILFRCDWWDVHKIGRGVKIDKGGVVSVNTRYKWNTSEPFVLMSQAQQVFYVRDGFDPHWLVVVKTHSRHQYDVPENENTEVDEDALQQSDSMSFADVFLSGDPDLEDIHNPFDGRRDDTDDIIIDANDQNQPKIFDGIENEDDEVDFDEDNDGDDGNDISDGDGEEDDDDDIA